GQAIAGCDLVAALLEAADSDRVIDLVGLRLSPGTETERGRADGNRADRGDEAVALGSDGLDDRCARKGVFGRVAALGRDPALVHRERGSVLDRGCGPLPPLL